MRNAVNKDMPTDFKGRLADALEGAPLSQARIARELGLSSRTRLTEWKSGAGAPPYDQIEELAELCGVDVRWLVTGQGNKKPVSLSAEVDAFRQIAAIVDRVRARGDGSDDLDLVEGTDDPEEGTM